MKSNKFSLCSTLLLGTLTIWGGRATAQGFEVPLDLLLKGGGSVIGNGGHQDLLTIVGKLKQISTFLETHEEGIAFCRTHRVQSSGLKSFASPIYFKIVELPPHEFKDNLGNVVHARLNHQNGIVELLEGSVEKLSYGLLLHELLRLSNYHLETNYVDDAYEISSEFEIVFKNSNKGKDEKLSGERILKQVFMGKSNEALKKSQGLVLREAVFLRTPTIKRLLNKMAKKLVERSEGRFQIPAGQEFVTFDFGGDVFNWTDSGLEILQTQFIVAAAEKNNKREPIEIVLGVDEVGVFERISPFGHGPGMPTQNFNLVLELMNSQDVSPSGLVKRDVSLDILRQAFGHGEHIDIQWSPSTQIDVFVAPENQSFTGNPSPGAFIVRIK